MNAIDILAVPSGTMTVATAQDAPLDAGFSEVLALEDLVESPEAGLNALVQAPAIVVKNLPMPQVVLAVAEAAPPADIVAPALPEVLPAEGEQAEASNAPEEWPAPPIESEASDSPQVPFWAMSAMVTPVASPQPTDQPRAVEPVVAEDAPSAPEAPSEMPAPSRPHLPNRRDPIVAAPNDASTVPEDQTIEVALAPPETTDTPAVQQVSSAGSAKIPPVAEPQGKAAPAADGPSASYGALRPDGDLASRVSSHAAERPSFQASEAVETEVVVPVQRERSVQPLLAQNSAPRSPNAPYAAARQVFDVPRPVSNMPIQTSRPAVVSGEIDAVTPAAELTGARLDAPTISQDVETAAPSPVEQISQTYAAPPSLGDQPVTFDGPVDEGQYPLPSEADNVLSIASVSRSILDAAVNVDAPAAAQPTLSLPETVKELPVASIDVAVSAEGSASLATELATPIPRSSTERAISARVETQRLLFALRADAQTMPAPPVAVQPGLVETSAVAELPTSHPRSVPAPTSFSTDIPFPKSGTVSPEGASGSSMVTEAPLSADVRRVSTELDLPTEAPSGAAQAAVNVVPLNAEANREPAQLMTMASIEAPKEMAASMGLTPVASSAPDIVPSAEMPPPAFSVARDQTVLRAAADTSALTMPRLEPAAISVGLQMSDEAANPRTVDAAPLPQPESAAPKVALADERRSEPARAPVRSYMRPRLEVLSEPMKAAEPSGAPLFASAQLRDLAPNSAPSPVAQTTPDLASASSTLKQAQTIVLQPADGALPQAAPEVSAPEPAMSQGASVDLTGNSTLAQKAVDPAPVLTTPTTTTPTPVTPVQAPPVASMPPPAVTAPIPTAVTEAVVEAQAPRNDSTKPISRSETPRRGEPPRAGRRTEEAETVPPTGEAVDSPAIEEPKPVAASADPAPLPGQPPAPAPASAPPVLHSGPAPASSQSAAAPSGQIGALSPGMEAPLSSTERAAATVREFAPRLVHKIAATGARKSEIILEPAELGRLRFELVTRGDKVEVHLQAERPEVVDLLRANAQELRQEFRSAGLDTGTMNFSQWSQNPRDERNAFAQSAASGGEGFAQSFDPSPEFAPQTPTPRSQGSGLDLRL